MIFDYYFGYHGLHARPLVEEDPNFDCESTGSLRIVANSDEEALAWGTQVAKWYLARLHGEGSGYDWSPGDYAVWTEREGESEFDTGTELIQVDAGEYPSFEALRKYLAD